MRKRRIERAIVLGLVLSSFSTLASAEINKDTEITEEQHNQQIVISLPPGEIYDDNKSVDVTGNDIILNYDNTFKGAAIWQGGIVISADNGLVVNNLEGKTQNNKGVRAYGLGVTLNAQKITFNTYDDAVMTEGRAPDGVPIAEGVKNDIIINANELNLNSVQGFGIVNNSNENTNSQNPNGIKPKSNIYVNGIGENSTINIQGGDFIEDLWIGGIIHVGEIYNPKAAIKNSATDTKTVVDADSINLQGVAFGTWAAQGNVEIYGKNNTISAILNGQNIDRYGEDRFKVYDNYGIGVYNQSTSIIQAEETNVIHGDKEAVKAASGTVTIGGKNNIFDVSYDESIIKAENKEQAQNADRYALHTASDTALIDVDATESNTITSRQQGIYAEKGTVDVKGTDNIIRAGSLTTPYEDFIYYGNDLAINAGSGTEYIGTVNLTAENGGNDISGAVKSINSSNVTIKGNSNRINSTAEVATQSGDMVTNESGAEVEKQNHIVSAVYVGNGGNVDITGSTQNVIATQADTSLDTLASETKERTIWAEDGTININGLTSIHASNGSLNDTNSVGVALAAGASRVVEGNPVEGTVPFSGVINANLADGSYIYGDMLAGNGGLLNIYKGAGVNSGISTLADGDAANGEPINNAIIQGNALSANGGELNLKLGTNTYWQGRADDYQDADNPDWSTEHAGIFTPEFSNNIESSGSVNVELDGATWEVTGQTWVTSVSGNGGTIDLSATPADRSSETHAMHIGNLTGSHNFVVNLDKEHSVSDMLYIYNVGEGVNDPNTYTQHVIINDIKGIENIADGEKLRFATVMPGVDNLYFTGEYEDGRLPNDTTNGATNGVSRAKMRARAAVPNVAMLRDVGAMNNSFLIKNENYSTTDTENTGYNGTQFNEVKPGNEYIDTNYEDGINWYLQRNKAGDEISDGGNTIINMSRANYSQAVYLDRLNKRLGEARYINGDEGLWVRMRHDKIDKDTGFEITTNMYELGYDKLKESKDKKGYHRQGVAIDYMDGDTDYKDVIGSGETNRKGIWLYDTWFGNKGHYTDYVFKWGHLENSFELFTRSRGEKVNGDYNNNVYSLSAEWGYKDIIDEDKENPENNKEKWYIEPQLQLQYARVTGADYTTSQGTDVSLDAIDSLIGRAGFRLGKDFGKEKKSTFYIKADILHEFLGDQDISVRDRTTGGQFTDWRYENEGTWYDVGLGFSTMLSDHSYAYLDVEKIFGGDNDDSYQISGGVEWKL
ncbi:autotransporter outer membrane beta-barrel domain-containing protein [Megamonas hypermegale]|uniref:autotransporter outer membrane beta-barrel domain-containing protein n=1 Tax=Megamonas hypermegale TaxID=158847 RepID=UPI0026F10A10|nr:autotransporter outer membrane beta-barrel domain-containing protein [Megamonas hypermegale]